MGYVVKNGEKNQTSKNIAKKDFNVLSKYLKKKECLLSLLKSYDYFK